MSNLHYVIDIAHDLKVHYPKLTDFEALQVASQIAQINLFEQAHVLQPEVEGAGALEKSAMQLMAIEGRLGEISDYLEGMLEDMQNRVG